MSVYEFEIPQSQYNRVMGIADKFNCHVSNISHRFLDESGARLSLSRVKILGSDENRKKVEWEVYQLINPIGRQLGETLVHAIPSKYISLMASIKAAAKRQEE